jgi:hypothetical protein
MKSGRYRFNLASQGVLHKRRLKSVARINIPPCLANFKEEPADARCQSLFEASILISVASLELVPARIEDKLLL